MDLCWFGRPSNANDRRGSLGLTRLARLPRPANLPVLSLRLGLSPAERKTLARFPNAVDLTETLKGFGESAALIVNLDLVISVETSVAHLAGAFGRPVSLMLPRPGACDAVIAVVATRLDIAAAVRRPGDQGGARREASHSPSFE